MIGGVNPASPQEMNTLKDKLLQQRKKILLEQWTLFVTRNPNCMEVQKNTEREGKEIKNQIEVNENKIVNTLSIYHNNLVDEKEDDYQSKVKGQYRGQYREEYRDQSKEEGFRGFGLRSSVVHESRNNEMFSNDRIYAPYRNISQYSDNQTEFTEQRQGKQIAPNIQHIQLTQQKCNQPSSNSPSTHPLFQPQSNPYSNPSSALLPSSQSLPISHSTSKPYSHASPVPQSQSRQYQHQLQPHHPYLSSQPTSGTSSGSSSGSTAESRVQVQVPSRLYSRSQVPHVQEQHALPVHQMTSAATPMTSMVTMAQVPHSQSAYTIKSTDQRQRQQRMYDTAQYQQNPTQQHPTQQHPTQQYPTQQQSLWAQDNIHPSHPLQSNTPLPLALSLSPPTWLLRHINDPTMAHLGISNHPLMRLVFQHRLSVVTKNLCGTYINFLFRFFPIGHKCFP